MRACRSAYGVLAVLMRRDIRNAAQRYGTSYVVYDEGDAVRERLFNMRITR